MSIVLAILALSMLIVVHEGGHMIVARWAGMRVERFSVFFGPVLARFKRGETEYQISAIPLGGFVQIAGMNPHEELPEGDTGSFENKPIGWRLATIFAGPATNYIFAVVLTLILFLGWGIPTGIVTTGVGQVFKGKPAAAAGMKAGDKILKIDGKEMKDSEEIRNAVIASKGERDLEVEVVRDSKNVVINMRARAKTTGGYEIGIQFADEVSWRKAPFTEASVAAFVQPAKITMFVVGKLWEVVTRQEEAKVGGPVEIVRQLKNQFEVGATEVIQALVMLNILLFIFNLLPIPALDGGRLAFLMYTAVTRRRVNPRVEAVVHTVGFVLLLGIFLLVTFNDIVRLSE